MSFTENYLQIVKQYFEERRRNKWWKVNENHVGMDGLACFADNRFNIIMFQQNVSTNSSAKVFMYKRIMNVLIR